MLRVLLVFFFFLGESGWGGVEYVLGYWFLEEQTSLPSLDVCVSTPKNLLSVFLITFFVFFLRCTVGLLILFRQVNSISFWNVSWKKKFVTFIHYYCWNLSRFLSSWEIYLEVFSSVLVWRCFSLVDWLIHSWSILGFIWLLFSSFFFGLVQLKNR